MTDAPEDSDSNSSGRPKREPPQFLQADDPETWDKPDDISWGDYSLDPDPNKPLKARHREVARLLFLGKTQTEVAETLGYTIPWLNRLANNFKIKEEIQRLQDAAFERTVGERLKELGPRAMNTLEEAFSSQELKLKDKVLLAQWIAEKLDGKAAQKVETKDSTLDRFISILEGMKQAGEVLDVTPQPQPQQSAELTAPELPEAEADPHRKWKDWLTED